MSEHFAGVSPDSFMANFSEGFGREDRIFEMVRRISEQDAAKKKNNKAAKSAVEKLLCIEIEHKHMQKKEGSRTNIKEAPTCTICVEHIKLKTKGMFMPCGHIYHPDCLKPWLETNNSCPICRFELPK